VPSASGAADRSVDRAGPRGDSAAGESQVETLDLAASNLPLQGGMRLIVAGDEHQAARSLVEPVHDAGALGIPSPAQQLPELIHKGRTPMRRRRMHDQPRRLLDDGEALVYVDETQVAHAEASSRR
jgi:hypothetical protein